MTELITIGYAQGARAVTKKRTAVLTIVRNADKRSCGKKVIKITNFEMLKKCETPEQFLRQWTNVLHCCCKQTSKEIWQKWCLSEEYRGEDGCQKCKVKYLNEEYEGR